MTKIRTRELVIPLLLVLASCATPYDPSSDIYDVADQRQVAKDKIDCAKQAAEYRRPFNTSGVAVAGAQGVSGNLGLGATGSKFTLLAPLLGGVGGILESTFQYFGVVDVDRPRAYQQCLRQHFDRDHAAVLVEPPL